jgi:hypothetical protein
MAGSSFAIPMEPFLDAVFLTSFIFSFFAIVEIITVHYLIVGDKESLAVRIHRSSLWIFPLAYFVVLVVQVPLFFVGTGRPQ